jgi:ABC-type branched-subunit amino acid transport system permease subunit
MNYMAPVPAASRPFKGLIPDVVWWMIFCGGVITIGFTCFFGFHDFRLHVVMTMTVAASLAVVVVLMVALDWRFRGEVSISPDAYIKPRKSWGNLPFNTQVGRTGDAPRQ